MSDPHESRPHPGIFIVLEGIDGSGSTTQTKLLAQALRERGLEVVETCEPSSGPIGALIRQVLQRRVLNEGSNQPRTFGWATLALLFAADRLDHVDSTIVPALRRGCVVLSDRYDLSSLAYQSVTAAQREEAVAWIRQLNAAALRPDLTLVIDVPAEVAEQRRRQRGGPEELFESRELQARLAVVYRAAERLVPGDKLEHVAGESPLPEVAATILALVTQAHSGFFGPQRRGPSPDA